MSSATDQHKASGSPAMLSPHLKRKHSLEADVLPCPARKRPPRMDLGDFGFVLSGFTPGAHRASADFGGAGSPWSPDDAAALEAAEMSSDSDDKDADTEDEDEADDPPADVPVELKPVQGGAGPLTTNEVVAEVEPDSDRILDSDDEIYVEPEEPESWYHTTTLYDGDPWTIVASGRYSWKFTDEDCIYLQRYDRWLRAMKRAGGEKAASVRGKRRAMFRWNQARIDGTGKGYWTSGPCGADHRFIRWVTDETDDEGEGEEESENGPTEPVRGRIDGCFTPAYSSDED